MNICEICQTEDARHIWVEEDQRILLCEECKQALVEKYSVTIIPVGIPAGSILDNMCKAQTRAEETHALNKKKVF